MEELDIQVADDAILRTTMFVHKVARKFKEDDLSRLERAEHLTNVLFGWIERGGQFLDASGNKMPMPPNVVEDAYRYGFKDGAFGDSADRAAEREVWFSWNSSVKKYADRAPRRTPRRALLPRLRLIDLAYKAEGRSLT